LEWLCGSFCVRPWVLVTLRPFSVLGPSLRHGEQQGSDFRHPRKPDGFQALVGVLPILG
jgi:hypothetical protein